MDGEERSGVMPPIVNPVSLQYQFTFLMFDSVALYGRVMLDPHRLRIFRSVVAGGSVRAAAASLGYTPSAVSQHISALQRETRLTLFERAGRGLRPTEAGRTLAIQADAVLAQLGQAEAVVADLRAGRTGSLSIAYFASIGSAWMPRIVRGLTERFPGVRLDLRLSESLPDDPDDRADVHLVVAGGDFAPGPSYSAYHLVDDPYVAVLPDGHPLAERDEVELTELSRERWIDNDFQHGWCRAVLLEACAAAGFNPPFHIEAHDHHTALAFVSAGIGITVLPRLGAAHLPGRVRSVPVVRPAPVRSILAVTRNAVMHTPAAAAALASLHQAAGTPTQVQTAA